MVPKGVKPRVCDTFESGCVDNVFDNSSHRALFCRDCYPGCKSTRLDFKKVRETRADTKCVDDDEGEYLYTKYLIEQSNLLPVLNAMNETGLKSQVLA